MINQTIFREYDIRGIVEQELNYKSVTLIGYFLGQSVLGNKRVAIGFDARNHSPILRDYLTSGLNAVGCSVFDMGMVATPVNYFANYQTEFDLDATVMITGSHNPKEYNGFKITVNKLPFFGEQIEALGKLVILNQDKEIPKNTTRVLIDVKTPYVDYMVKYFEHLRGLKTSLVIDCGNGVAGTVITDIFNALDFQYFGLYCAPDGDFPNHHPDPSEEKNLVDIKQALHNKGDIGFAYDGDADRIAVLTHEYNIKGDKMALLFALLMKTPTVIGEVKCSQVMYDELEKRGCHTIMYKTGHSNLKVKIYETNADLACEVSGHIFFNDRYFGYDDAIYATLRILELIHNGIDLDNEIRKLPQVYTTEEIKIETVEDKKFLIIDEIKKLLSSPPKEFPEIKKLIEIDGLRIHFEKGWALIRASNTTPVLVTRFEAINKDLIDIYKENMDKIVKKAIGNLE